MRGFDTQGSIFIDGIRDLGTVTRDTFNTEQVEIAKGPAGPDYGRGAASGYVNLASKVPTADNFTARQRQLRHRLQRAASRATSTIASKAAAPRCASTSWARTATSTAATSSSARAGQSRRRWPSDSRATRAPTSIYCTPSRTTSPTAACPTIGLEGFYNPAFDPTRCRRRPGNAGVDARAGRPREFLRLRAATSKRSRARCSRPASSTISATTSRCATPRATASCDQFYVLTGVNALTVTESESRPVDRGAHAPEQVPGKHAAHQPDQRHGESAARAASSHAITGGFEFIDEEQYNPAYVGLRASAPLRRRMSTTRTATMRCRTMRRCAMACTRAAKRRPPAPTCSTP